MAIKYAILYLHIILLGLPDTFYLDESGSGLFSEVGSGSGPNQSGSATLKLINQPIATEDTELVLYTTLNKRQLKAFHVPYWVLFAAEQYTTVFLELTQVCLDQGCGQAMFNLFCRGEFYAVQVAGIAGHFLNVDLQ
jgi:hypothetical protein